MSLRGFHIFFIIACTILCLVVSGWCFFFAPRDGGLLVKALGGVMLLGAIIAPIYGIRFYQKAKNLIL